MAQFYDVQGGYSVDDLLPGIQHFESGGRRYAVSPKGAIGLYQIMPNTAAMFGYSAQDMFDPKKNEDVARRYLDGLLKQYNGNAYMALAAYNSGPKTVGQGIIPPETQQYVHDVLGYTRGFTGGKQAGQRIRQEQASMDPVSRQLQANIDDLKKQLKEYSAQYDTSQQPQAPQGAIPSPQQDDAHFLGSVLLNSMFGRYGGQMQRGQFPGEAPLTQVQPGPMSRLFSSTVGKI